MVSGLFSTVWRYAVDEVLWLIGCHFSFFVDLFRADEEAARRSELEKIKREMDNQIEELKDDLDAEKSARTKAEKQRRELSEVKEYSIPDFSFK